LALSAAFVGEITGRTAAVGVAARNGAQMAVEQMNRAGGINGRRVELIIKDIGQDGVAGLNAIEELKAENVPAIIGPMTSTMAMLLAPLVNESGILMVSPTASTLKLGAKDDNFLRIRPQCSVVASRLADYVVDEKGLRQISIIYDAGNSGFTADWKQCFSQRIVSKGGVIVRAVAFDSDGQHSFTDLVHEATEGEVEGLLILANSLDTALISQQLLKQGKQLPVFASEWSSTKDLLRSGGRSVEGMTFFHVFDESSTKQKYLDFKERYQAYYMKDISFPTVHAYDAAQIVLAGLKLGARSGPELKTVLLQQQSFDTLQSTIRFDQFGDVDRNLFLTVIKEGKFVVVQ
jgi:branched-chain amino acid transport system substrate-binding protein